MSETTYLDRRTFTRLAGASGVAAVAGCPGSTSDTTQPDDGGTATPGSSTETQQDEDEPEDDETEYEFFDTEQAATVETVVDRLLPAGDDRPAGSEIGVVRYIDRALRREPFYETAHDGRQFQDAYESGLEKLDGTAEELFDAPVRELDDDQVDDLVAQILDRSAPGWENVATANAVSMTVPAEAFVTVLRDHAVEGYYTQPKYGGNADLEGWKQAGYTGPFVEGYRPDELRPPWKSFDEHEQEKSRPSDLYGEFGGDDDA